jgi:DNA-binding transcriptional ArsR family regulator
MVAKKRPYDRHAPRNRQCKTCQHPERHRIESLLAGGASLESVGIKFGLSKDTLSRHMTRHVHPEDMEILKGAPATLANLAERAAAENMSILDYLSILRSRLMRQLEASSAAGDNIGVNRTCSTLLAVLQELGRLTGEIDRVTSAITINNNPQTVVQMTDPLVAKLQAGLLKCLAPYPDARRAVVKMLTNLEGASDHINGQAVLPPPLEIEGAVNG